jgi:hypothetical protein
MHGSRSKIPSKISVPYIYIYIYIYDVKCLALLGAPYIYDISRLRVKGLYMFRGLLDHPQEVLHKRHLVYCVRVIFQLAAPGLEIHFNPGAAN